MSVNLAYSGSDGAGERREYSEYIFKIEVR